MDFSKYFQMLDELVKINGAQKSNFMYSPASLYSALQAAAYGADGNTREEIINLIGEKKYDLNSEAVNTWNFFVVNHKKGRKAEIRTEYAELLKTDRAIRATAYELTEDNDSKLAEVINSRCKEATNGQITNAVSPDDFQDISPVDKFTALLGNVLHFKGKWQGNCGLISDFTFTGADGKEKMVNAVDMGIACPGYCSNKSMEAFYASYIEDDWRYTFWGFLPRNAEAYDVDSLDFSNLRGPKENYTMSVSIPKFQIQSRMNMKEALNHFGVRDAFDHQTADFSKGFWFSPLGNVYLNSIRQQTIIDFNETGTEASSCIRLRAFWTTGGTILGFKLNFDRPFYFMILDEVEKLPLFVGQVFEPVYEK
ncbi:MAG: serpin family protein [Lachnospiraceae bacterium]|nr:serpin family protein [Lachnospiraceae bacterium]